MSGLEHTPEEVEATFKVFSSQLNQSTPKEQHIVVVLQLLDEVKVMRNINPSLTLEQALSELQSLLL